MKCKTCKHFMEVKFKYDNGHNFWCLVNQNVFNTLKVGNTVRDGLYEYYDLIECNKFEEKES